MTKPLSDIPDQATVMVDTNIVIYALFPQGPYHHTCKDLLQRAARSDRFVRRAVQRSRRVCDPLRRSVPHGWGTNPAR